MDLIRIDDNKLKIMLTPKDMQSYSLDANKIDYTDVETREAFRHILDEARDRTGFDAKGNQIYVQLYPSRGGGCEMFVTKLGVVCALGESEDHPTEPTTSTPLIGTGVNSLTRSQYTPQTERSRTVAFVFDALDYLIGVCRRLRAREFCGNSAAYHGEEGRYYLLLTERISGRRGMLFDRALLSLLGEYGTQKNADTVQLYIREHADPICEKNAIMRLADL